MGSPGLRELTRRIHKPPPPPLVAPPGPNQEEQSTARSQASSAPTPCPKVLESSGWTPHSARASLLPREANLAQAGAGMEPLGTDTSLGATFVLKQGQAMALRVLPPIPVATRALQRGNKVQEGTSPIWPPNWPSEPPCWRGSLCLQLCNGSSSLLSQVPLPPEPRKLPGLPMACGTGWNCRALARTCCGSANDPEPPSGPGCHARTPGAISRMNCGLI